MIGGYLMINQLVEQPRTDRLIATTMSPDCRFELKARYVDYGGTGGLRVEYYVDDLTDAYLLGQGESKVKMPDNGKTYCTVNTIEAVCQEILDNLTAEDREEILASNESE